MSKLVRKKKSVWRDTPSSERSSVFSYHGGWSHGYLEGRISAIDDIIDILRDQEDSQ